MLARGNFTLEKVRQLQAETKRDPALLERVIYAFGLLEALSLVGLEFIFKGGTCLMLLLDKPKRLSTDIDIIVEPGTDIDDYIEKASEIFPFVSVEEQNRSKVRNIEKRHFMFYYASPVNGDTFHIILDVVFEDGHYSSTVQKEIANSLLDIELPSTYVTVPTLNGILGDKLTAFAPHTIGIRFGEKKELEIIKQFYDIATLMDEMDDFEEVKATYEQTAAVEIEYRALQNIGIKETLLDSFHAAISIISKGTLFQNDYSYLLDGMRRIKNHIFDSFSPVVAEAQACQVAYLIANVLADSKTLPRIADVDSYADMIIAYPFFAKLNFVKRSSLTNFAYLYEAIKLYETVNIAPSGRWP